MIKTGIVTFVLQFICLVAFSQERRIDSIGRKLTMANNDTSRVLLMADLSFAYNNRNSDTALIYAERAIKLAKEIRFTRGEIRAVYSKAQTLETNGDMPQALQLAFNGLERSQKENFPLEMSMYLTLIGNVFFDLNDYPKAISFYQQAVPINQAIQKEPGTAFWRWLTEVNLGTVFMLNHQLDSSFAHLEKAYAETVHNEFWHPVFLMFFGQLQFEMGKVDTGLGYLRESIKIFENNNDIYSSSDASRIIASCFRKQNKIDSTIYYARNALLKAQAINYTTSIVGASKLLAEVYESNDIGKALYFRKVFDSANNILYGPDKVKGLQKTLSDEQDRQRKREAEAIAHQNQLKEYLFIAGFSVVFVIALIFYRNNIQKKKANSLLRIEKEKVESTLQELKTTQAQLIQSEKMASLGQLTAGIAHEIQNPLNFVNNFSSVNAELLAELKTEAEAGNVNEVLALANDIQQNEEKIVHHGGRADAIVKSMLQHSRTATGEKALIDLNTLADKYLRLSYHGMRSKDQAFNAEIKTDFDEDIGSVNAVSSDIGRVLLNLFNNAFYTVNEKAKTSSSNGRYQPLVRVITKKLNNAIEIKVEDNGTGIPQKNLDKIFQPFFTTKPTGQGTGLGLSLSYDIITKEHNGTIKVESKEGEYSRFIIQLPKQ